VRSSEKKQVASRLLRNRGYYLLVVPAVARRQAAGCLDCAVDDACGQHRKVAHELFRKGEHAAAEHVKVRVADGSHD
jgi:hypothetical protein